MLWPLLCVAGIARHICSSRDDKIPPLACLSIIPPTIPCGFCLLLILHIRLDHYISQSISNMQFRRSMCSSAAAICPSSSSSSIGNCVLPRLKEQEGPSPTGTSSSDEHNKDTGNSGHCKVKRSASEPGLQCLVLLPKESKASIMRRGSDSPKHYSSLISSESTIETVISSSSLDLDSSSSTCSSSMLSPDTKKAQRRRSSVQFGSLTIRNYEVQLGDNPSCSNGAPVSIGWRYNELNPICIEKYEEWMKDKRRSRSEFHLPRSHRESILREYGYSRSQMTEATKEVAKIKKQRRASLKTTPISRLRESSWSFIEMKTKRRSSC